MTQCDRCTTGRLKIEEDAKKWIPYKNITVLNFKTENGQSNNFKVKYADTTKQAQSVGCASIYLYDSTGFTVTINESDSAVISIRLGSPSAFSLLAMDKSNLYLSMGSFFEGYGSQERELRNYVINNKQYARVRLINAYVAKDIDSIYIAKNSGIVSFKYKSEKYFLQ